MDDAENAVPKGCWLTDLAQIGESVIQGQGLFAVADIAAGETVMRLGGDIIDDDELAEITAGAEPYDSVTIGEGRHLLLTDPTHPARYGNHSCAPNLWHGEDDVTLVVARRDIAVGEELTIDYATHTGVETWSMPCNCRTPACRGNVTGRDWRRPDLRERYRRHWATPLLARIDADDPSR